MSKKLYNMTLQTAISKIPASVLLEESKGKHPDFIVALIRSARNAQKKGGKQ